MQIAQHSLEAKKTFMCNLSAPFIPQFFKAGVLEALPYVDVMFGNETEAAAFGAANGLENKDDVKAVAQYIADMDKKDSSKPRVCVITQVIMLEQPFAVYLAPLSLNCPQLRCLHCLNLCREKTLPLSLKLDLPSSKSLWPLWILNLLSTQMELVMVRT